MMTHRSWRTRGVMLLAAAAILGSFAWLGSELMAQDRSSDQPAAVTEQLKEIRSLLADQSKSEKTRIDQALSLIDDQLKNTSTIGGGGTREALIPSQPSQSQPFQGMTIFKGDPFGDPAAGNGTWDPFQEMQHMQNITDQLFSNAFQQFRSSPRYGGLTAQQSFTPNMDLTESEDAYTVKVDLPGISKDDVNVEVSGQVLTVSGKRSQSVEQKDANGKIVRQERQIGEFKRSMALPGPVETGKINAKYDNGVLTVTLPKKGDQGDGSQLVPIK